MKLILGMWKSNQTFSLEIINIFYLTVNNQKEGGLPARIVGAENEKPEKDYVNYLWSKSDVL